MKNSLTKDCGPKNMDHGLLPSNRRPLPPGYEQFGIRRSSFAGWAAFSLIEILVTIALLTFIILGLFAMFNQTQRAFTSSMTQSDVLEAGRAATDMLARDLERTIPSDRNAVNFYTQIPTFVPLTQSLPGAVPPAKIADLPFSIASQIYAIESGTNVCHSMRSVGVMGSALNFRMVNVDP